MADSSLQGVDSPQLAQLCGGHWVLARLSCHLDKPLYRGTSVRLSTSLRGLDGGLIYRDTELFVENHPIGRAVSAWAVADGKTNKMLWPAQLPAVLTQKAESGLRLRKLHLQTDLSSCYMHTVRYSDLDENGHMNNARYADLCCNAIALQELCSCWVQTMDFGYMQQCCPGQELCIYTGTEDNLRLFRGQLQTGTCFEARMLLTSAF